MRMKNITHRMFLFSEAQEKFLRDKRYKIDRMECFLTLVDRAVTEVTAIPLSKTQSVELLPGQFMVSDVEIAKLWNMDRKTVSRLMKKMEELGILSSVKVADVSIHTIHPYSAWYLDGERTYNDFNTWPQKNGAPDKFRKPGVNRIITTEPPKAEEAAKGKDTAGVGIDKANGNSTPAAGAEIHKDGQQETAQPSPSANAGDSTPAGIDLKAPRA